ncbi:unnamed protein product, partial [marine sediment metagenome]
MHEFMGVRVDSVECTVEAELTKILEPVLPEGGVAGDSEVEYALDSSLNDGFAAVNRLFSLGANVWRSMGPLDCGDGQLPPGSFIIKGVEKEQLERVAEEMHIHFLPLTKELGSTMKVSAPRIGMYQRYYGGNADEGWTRLVLEQFGFPYETLKDEDIKKGGLSESLDVIILPDDPEAMIT